MTAMIIPEQSTTDKTIGLTYEEWRRLPMSRLPQEVINGELMMAPAPSFDHQQRNFRLAKLLDRYIEAEDLGILMDSPLDIVIRRAPKLQTRQPDVAFFSKARTGLGYNDSASGLEAQDERPDLVVEMLSPNEPRRTLGDKLQDYASIGVAEVWLVSREAETVEVLRLHGGEYDRAGLYGLGDMLISLELPAVNLTVDTLFGR